MQQLSNDTSSWNIIDIPLPSPLFYNSNTYDNLANVSATLNGNDHLLPISFDPSSSITPTPETHSINYWAFALLFFPILTIFGNVLVVVSVYREKSLHTVTNYFVVSLAISDITVAAVVMPFAIYLEVSIRSY
jgi:dopamine D2-like receptor